MRDPATDRENFLEFRAAYQPGLYPDSEWLLGERGYYRSLDDDAKPSELLTAAIAYREQQQALGKLRTNFVRSPK